MTTGIWLFGAKGGLATTAIVGARALAQGLTNDFGLLSESPALADLDLTGFDELVFGGHDIRSGSLWDQAQEIDRDSRSLPPELLNPLREDLANIDGRIKPGTTLGCGDAIESLEDSPESTRSLKEWIGRLRQDLADFKRENQIERLVAVHTASTEPVMNHAAQASLSSLESAIENNQKEGIQASVLYAYAALHEGAALINFTPSHGTLCPAIRELADRLGCPYMGSDGKTGETLLKSVLAPMFRDRRLEVLTWQGYNMLGDRDGQVLSRPENSEAKIRSKDHLVGNILGYNPHTEVRIDYVPSLGDQKTAWDFIHFRGFLGFKMSMQFVWQGCDAILGAPLILDLVRFADLALKRRESGPMTYLSSFFKSPMDTDEHDFQRQIAHLHRHFEGNEGGKSSSGK